ncbi:MAG: NAD(P)H-dependent oxidoreductase [Oscillospiraceae bacterium]|nr:NAD(P)H-dependent oxidoreductase [Oscillospiraceae bacterium]
MRVFVVYCHPSSDSFTHAIYERFTQGLRDAGHDITVSDLYGMNFRTDISEEEYLRETFYRSDLPLPADVAEEQRKIEAADAMAFVYPVFWTEAPAKLVGWFDRVWTAGYAYADCTMKILDKAVFLACAGKTLQSLEETGNLRAMETVMLGDRINQRAREKRMFIFDGISHYDEELLQRMKPQHLERAYRLGREF